jgi:hypothetical protein
MNNEALKLYTLDENGASVPFKGISIIEYTYTGQRSSIPSITASFKYKDCLDEKWTLNEFVKFRGEEYHLENTPTSSKSNDDERYKHECTFVSERERLAKTLFRNVVDNGSTYADKSTEFTVYATPAEFVYRLNCALKLSGLGDSAMENNETLIFTEDSDLVGDGYVAILADNTSYDKDESYELSFDNNYIFEAIGSFSEESEILYEFRDKKIIFGALPTVITPASDLTFVFKYGAENSLLSVTKNNSGNAIINRITFKGSSDNIPYYYPNETEEGDVHAEYGINKKVNPDAAPIDDILTVVDKARFVSAIKGRIVTVCDAGDVVLPVNGNGYIVETYEDNDNEKGDRVPMFSGLNSSVSDSSTSDDTANQTYSVGSYAIDLPEWKSYFWVSVCVIVESDCYAYVTRQEYSYRNGKGVVEDWDLVDPSDSKVKRIVLTDVNGKILRDNLTRVNGTPAGTEIDCDHYIQLHNGKTKAGTYYLLFRMEFEGSQGIDDPTEYEDGYTHYMKYIQFYSYLECACYGAEPVLKLDNGKTQGYWDTISDVTRAGLEKNGNFTLDHIGSTLYYVVDFRHEFSSYLLPYVYRTENRERFYNAINYKYEKENGTFRYFKHPFTKSRSSEYQHEDDTIKPTIKGIVNSDGIPFGTILNVAFDDDDNDYATASDDSATYDHPYFYVKIPRFMSNDGYGFNLFDRISEGENMVLQMTSGPCNGCKFNIKGIEVVDEFGNNRFYNPVLIRNEKEEAAAGENATHWVDLDGNIINGEVVQSYNKADVDQQDTEIDSVWLVLQKEEDTFGIIMPNAYWKYRPQKEDTFNITGINLPDIYITEAEKRGEEATLDKLEELNNETFTFDISMSRIFFTRRVGLEVLEQLDEFCKIPVSYNGIRYELYISELSFEIKEGDALPEIKVTISDETSSGVSISDKVADIVMKEIGTEEKSSYKTASNRTSSWVDDDSYLHSEEDDEANGHITFNNGLTSNGDVEIGSYDELLQTGAKITKEGHATLRSLEVTGVLNARELRLNQITAYTGVSWQTHGAGLIESVEVDTDEDGNPINSGTITLHLEQGQYGSVELNDLCMGIFHSYTWVNATEDSDARNMNMQFAGFSTVYFRVDEILDDMHSKFHYVLRSPSKDWPYAYHPQPQMSFACYANPTNTDRQSCIYSTTKYTIGLQNMTTWTYGDANIYKIEGVLEGFSLSGKQFHGTGVVLGNFYYYGTQNSFVNAPLKMNIDTQGVTALATNESLKLTATCTKGYSDVDSGDIQWTITRETSYPEDDKTWNASEKAKSFKGEIEITYADLGVDNNIYGQTALFVITAEYDDDKAEANIII